MTTSRIAALLLTCSLAGAGAVSVAPSASAATGWTGVGSDYAVDVGDPTFDWCEVSETGTKVTLRIRATRSSAAVVSHSTYWNRRKDFTGAAGSASGSTWTGDRSTVRLTLPRSSYLRISYQTARTGYAFTELRRTPVGLARCP